jgi:hypothetical protein
MHCLKPFAVNDNPTSQAKFNDGIATDSQRFYALEVSLRQQVSSILQKVTTLSVNGRHAIGHFLSSVPISMTFRDGIVDRLSGGFLCVELLGC